MNEVSNNNNNNNNNNNDDKQRKKYKFKIYENIDYIIEILEKKKHIKNY